MIIKKVCQFLCRDKNTNNSSSNYVSLTPTSDADEDGCYAKALKFALEEDDILNVAVTGPYGSGKSSVLKSFEKKIGEDFKFLKVSLAAFTTNRDSPTPIDDKLIEHSILQQILYKEDRDSLPLSLLRRLSESRNIRFVAYLFPAWLISLLIVMIAWPETKALVSIPNNYIVPVWTLTTIVISGFVLAIIDLFRYVAYKQVSVNLKTDLGALQIGANTDQSILNKNIDEILYFFSKTDYQAVIIEDLDRFGNTDVFVKLREINLLINQSRDVKHIVKFIYAIKDEFFVHNDRTKFFDFIIPIVPIINSSNSLEKFKEQLRNSPIDDNINDQFLKEVSLYIDDLRLLSNIINEMNLYFELFDRLKTNSTKLLAIIIYKNVFPDDFSDLNNNTGIIYNIIKKRASEISSQRSKIENEIKQLKSKLKQINENNIGSIEELNRIYLSRLYELLGQNEAHEIYLGNQRVSITSLVSDDNFTAFRNEGMLYSHNFRNQRLALNTSFALIESDINKNISYSERREILLASLDKMEISINAQINELRRKQFKLSSLSLTELISSNPDMLTLTKELDNEYRNSGLLRYLLSNGWIDEHYQDYIARFHEGSLSTDDINFVRSIRDSVPVDPSFSLSNPKEVIDQLREEDFKGYLIFNYSLMNYLAEEFVFYNDKISLLADSFLEYPNEISSFIESYLNTSDKASNYLKYLLQVKPDLCRSIIENTSLNITTKTLLIRNILLDSEHDFLIDEINVSNVLTNFISNNPTSVVIDNNVKNEHVYNVLLSLGVKFTSLKLISSDKSFIKYIYENSLYRIGFENVNIILNECGHPAKEVALDVSSSNLTTIKESDCEYLINYIDANLDEYLNEVFFKLETNTKESDDIIISLYENDSIALEIKKRILEKQDWVASSIESIPEPLWGNALTIGKVKLDWSNVFSYFKHIKESKLDIVLIEAFNDKAVYESLAKSTFSESVYGEEDVNSISSEIINNNEVSNEAFDHLVASIPYKYNSLGSYDLSDERIITLLKSYKLNLTKEMYEFIQSNHPQSLGILFKNNIKDFLDNFDQYPINDDDALFLLESEIESSIKVKLLTLLDDDLYSNNEAVSLKSVELFLEQDLPINDLPYQSLIALLSNVRDEVMLIKMITMYIKILLVSDIKSFFSSMSKPYNQLSESRKQSKIKDNDINRKLINALESKKYISSWKEDGRYLRVFPKLG